MKIIDAMSGKQIQPGETIYGRFTLHDVYKKGGKTFGDMTIYAATIPGGKWRKQVELQRRFMHPRFLFQNVAFIPS